MILQGRVRRYAMHWFRITQRSRLSKKTPTDIRPQKSHEEVGIKESRQSKWNKRHF